MTVNVKYHDPVYTKDGDQLGLAMRFHRSTDTEGMETGKYTSHLKLFDFSTGDDYFIPTEFIGSRDSKGGVHLLLTTRAVNNMSLSREPRYVAYELDEKTELEKRDA